MGSSPSTGWLSRGLLNLEAALLVGFSMADTFLVPLRMPGGLREWFDRARGVH